MNSHLLNPKTNKIENATCFRRGGVTRAILFSTHSVETEQGIKEVVTLSEQYLEDRRQGKR